MVTFFNFVAVFGVQGFVVTFYCSILGGVDASSIKWSNKRNLITVDSSKYCTSSNGLQISNIMSQDKLMEHTSAFSIMQGIKAENLSLLLTFMCWVG